MNKIKVIALAAVMVAFTLSALLAGRPARASHPAETTQFGYVRTGVLEPGITWVDQYGVHIRDRVEVGRISGDLQGSALVVYNADLSADMDGRTRSPDPVPGSGVAYGTISIFGERMDPAKPRWAGEWTYQLKNGKVTSGELKAMDWTNTLILIVESVVEDSAGTVLFSGFIDHLFCPDSGCTDPNDW